MKKTSTLLLVLLAMAMTWIAISVPSCKPKRRTFSIAYMEIWADSLKKVMMNICQEWAEQNNVTLAPPRGEEWKLNDAGDKAADYIQGNTNLDLVMFPNDYAVSYQNDLRDYSPVMERITEMYPGVQPISAAILYDAGRWFGVPAFSWSHLMVIRKDILDSIGEPIPDSFEALARVAEKMNKPAEGFIGFGLGLGKDDDFAMFFQSLLWSYGGSIFDENGRGPRFDRVNTRIAVNYVLGLYEKTVFPQGALQWDGSANNRAFLGLKTGLTFNSPTIYYVAKRTDPELAKKIVHALYPKSADGRRHQYVTGFCFVSREKGPNRDLADSFLEYLYQPRNYARLIAAGEGSVNPAFLGLDTLAIWNDPNLRIALESMQYEHPVGWPGPTTKVAADIFRSHLATMTIANIIDGKMPVDDAIRAANSEMVEKISANRSR